MFRAEESFAMAPRHLASNDVMAQRKRAYVNEQTTSHWAYRFFADDPVATPTKSDADLTPVMRRLIGYRDDDTAAPPGEL